MDVGDKWIGVALSDPLRILASPLVILRRDNDVKTVENIEALVKTHQPDLLVIGLPVSLNGTIGPQAEKVKAFSGLLSQSLNTEIVFRDERFSTDEARRKMNDSGKNNKTVRDDAAAAAVILQDYLDETNPPCFQP
ncbi:MAG: Holliday junction resolvase RuvX [Dehalococcoides mccartyi]|uniref:Holliday junction resolvase RuvX n=1 Tax=Dehalococcoides TaxID=61434 RepID=UPI0009B8D709|nr:Holliday junction resolvase RuvX [Dehalococcoides mccartyi]MBF4482349.1 Holliday junction resolvase RuvX [Dehalococcoides mccartyi]MBJ7531687.1 Holliday junction resolvase RuvX [Dehalococcoides mccartyi]MDP4279662.1 Holliday junction resolvase RuvX [Dehalococcoides mccartyi]